MQYNSEISKLQYAFGSLAYAKILKGSTIISLAQDAGLSGDKKALRGLTGDPNKAFKTSTKDVERGLSYVLPRPIKTAKWNRKRGYEKDLDSFNDRLDSVKLENFACQMETDVMQCRALFDDFGKGIPLTPANTLKYLSHANMALGGVCDMMINKLNDYSLHQIRGHSTIVANYVQAPHVKSVKQFYTNGDIYGAITSLISVMRDQNQGIVSTSGKMSVVVPPLIAPALSNFASRLPQTPIDQTAVKAVGFKNIAPYASFPDFDLFVDMSLTASFPKEDMSSRNTYRVKSITSNSRQIVLTRTDGGAKRALSAGLLFRIKLGNGKYIKRTLYNYDDVDLTGLVDWYGVLDDEYAAADLPNQNGELTITITELIRPGVTFDVSQYDFSGNDVTIDFVEEHAEIFVIPPQDLRKQFLPVSLQGVSGDKAQFSYVSDAAGGRQFSALMSVHLYKDHTDPLLPMLTQLFADFMLWGTKGFYGKILAPVLRGSPEERAEINNFVPMVRTITDTQAAADFVPLVQTVEANLDNDAS